MDRKGVPDLFRDTEPIEMEGYSTDLITLHAIEFLRTMKDRPFFLYVPYNAPHFPFQGPDDADKKVEPGKKSWQIGSRATYVKMVESMDAGIGRVLREADELGLRDRTLVVFTSDNGGDVHSRNAPLAKGKGTLWEGGIRVPSVARWPGVLPAGVVSKQVGITMDWSATILRLARAELPPEHTLDGIDLLPILSGEKPNVRRTLFWRRVKESVRKGVDPHRAVRDGKWKYIDKPDATQYLYDLSIDAGETENLALQQPGRASMLKKLLDTWESGLENPAHPNE
jgi:arylsulfatase A-like enzyme